VARLPGLSRVKKADGKTWCPLSFILRVHSNCGSSKDGQVLNYFSMVKDRPEPETVAAQENLHRMTCSRRN